MKQLTIDLEHELENEELRLISFASMDILSYDIMDNGLHLTVYDFADLEQVKNNVSELLGRKRERKSETIFTNTVPRDYTSDEDILKSKIIQSDYDGRVILSELGIKLFEFFDDYFKSILDEYEVTYLKFPTLLDMETLSDTNYLQTSPQYVLFCSKVKEAISEYKELHNKYQSGEIDTMLSYPQYALSPSACFHLYQYLRGKEIDSNQIFSLRQNVFRNEGRFNWKELSRLQDYNIREIVMIGDHDYVLDQREKLLHKTLKLLQDLNMNYSVEIATDPFVMPLMQKYEIIQRFNKVKYELRINTGMNSSIACASFNIHGKAFTNRFQFMVKGNADTESGCIGFGIERCIIAFLNQYGVDQKNWPEVIRKYIS